MRFYLFSTYLAPLDPCRRPSPPCSTRICTYIYSLSAYTARIPHAKRPHGIHMCSTHTCARFGLWLEHILIYLCMFMALGVCKCIGKDLFTATGKSPCIDEQRVVSMCLLAWAQTLPYIYTQECISKIHYLNCWRIHC